MICLIILKREIIRREIKVYHGRGAMDRSYTLILQLVEGYVFFFFIAKHI